MSRRESSRLSKREAMMKCVIKIMSDGSRQYVDTLVPKVVDMMGLDPSIAEVPVYRKESKLRYDLRWVITACKQAGLISEVERTRKEIDEAMALSSCAEGNLPA